MVSSSSSEESAVWCVRMREDESSEEKWASESWSSGWEVKRSRLLFTSWLNSSWAADILEKRGEVYLGVDLSWDFEDLVSNCTGSRDMQV